VPGVHVLLGAGVLGGVVRVVGDGDGVLDGGADVLLLGGALHDGVEGPVLLLVVEVDGLRLDGAAGLGDVELLGHAHGVEAEERVLRFGRQHLGLALLSGHLLPVDHLQLRDLLDQRAAQHRAAADGVVDDDELLQVLVEAQLLHVLDLVDLVAGDLELLERLERLEALQVLDQVVVELEDLEVDAVLEAALLDELDAVARHVELLQVVEVAEEVQLGDAVVGELEAAQVLEARELEAVGVREQVVAQVEVLEADEAQDAFGLALLLVLEQDAVDLVLAHVQLDQPRQLAETAQAVHEVVAQLQVLEVHKELLVEHVVVVLQVAAGQVELAHLLQLLAVEFALEQLVSDAAGLYLLGTALLQQLDTDAVEHLELAQLEHDEGALVLLAADAVAREVEDDQLVELLQLVDLLHLVDAVVRELELHEVL